jgi:DNA-binding transcriptional MerR regulator
VNLPLRFRADQAGAYSGATPRQLRYWDQIGLVRPSIQAPNGHSGIQRIYSREDVLRLRAVVCALDEDGASLQKINAHRLDTRHKCRPRCPGNRMELFLGVLRTEETWRRDSIAFLFKRTA